MAKPVRLLAGSHEPARDEGDGTMPEAEKQPFMSENGKAASTSHRTEELLLNMGPQHPSTHGVLRVVLKLDGERITKATPDLGYLHRGVEKLCEGLAYMQIIPHTDRLDYVCSMTNNYAYVRTVEKLLQITIPERAEYIRTIVAEMQRIIGHLFWLGTQASGYRRNDRVFLDFPGARNTVGHVRKALRRPAHAELLSHRRGR